MELELLTPEDRWLDPEDESDLIEVYKKYRARMPIFHG
jgi:hypothetical protein